MTAAKRVVTAGLAVLAILAGSDRRPLSARAAYTLSGSPDGTGIFLVDDNLDVFVNGIQVVADNRAAGTPADHAPIPITADVGDIIDFRVRDTYGVCAKLTTVFLTDAAGRSTVADPGFDVGCGRENTDLGIVHTYRFVIPDLSVTPRAELAAEVNASGNANPGEMTVFQNALYFAATDAANDRELWRLGTTGSATLVANINLAGSSSPAELTVVGDRLYFKAFTPDYGLELWQYDGITSPSLAADINPGTAGSNLQYLTAYGNQVVFQAEDPQIGRELFAFDTVNGLQPKDIEKVSASCQSAPDCWSIPESLTVYSGLLYFSAFQTGTGFQLYSYNGSTYTRLTNNIGGAAAITGLGKYLIFGGFDFGQFRVYSYDIDAANGSATQLSTAVFRDPGRFSPNGYEPVVFNDRVYFVANDGTNGEELWSANGVAASLAADLTPGPTSSLPQWLHVFNGELYFRATEPTAGLEPRAFNGVAPPRLVKDLVSGPSSGAFEGPAPLGQYLVFQAFGPSGRRIWFTTGSESPTDVIDTPTGAALFPEDDAFTLFNGALYVNANQQGSGTQLWRIAVGAAVPTTITLSSSRNPSAVGDQVRFTATVTSAGAPPSGTVTFFDQITPIGTVSLVSGVASLDTSTLAAGSHTITARYNGDATYAVNVSGPLVQVVDPQTTTPTTTTLTSSPNPSAFGGLVTLTATVSGGTLPTGTVTFFDGNVSLATVGLTGDTATYVAASLGGGSHTLTARYNGDSDDAPSTSNAVTHVVSRAASSTTLSATPNPSAVGTMVEFTAIISPGVNFSGTVTFRDGATTLQVVPFNGNTASFQTSALSAGSHTMTATFDGDGNYEGSTSNAVVQVVTQPATLNVIKQVINDNGGTATPASFTITVTGNAPAPASFPGSATGTVVTLGPGEYRVNEAADPAYATTFGVDCTGVIAAGETKTCTVTNDDRPTTLQLTKVVLNDNGGAALPTAWTLTANGQPFTSGVLQQVTPGAFTLAESGGPSGYTPSSWSCFGGAIAGNVVTVAANTAVQCSITNDDQQASLTLTKVVINDNGGTAAPGDWQLLANQIAFVSGVPQSINAGSYALTEAGGPPGYVAGSWSCTGATLVGNNLGLVPGQTASCTITNDDQQATLNLIKVVINDNAGTSQPGDFTLTVRRNGLALASVPGSAGTPVIITPGSYTVTETGPGRYDATFSADCTASIAVGETKTCTITNDDRPNAPPVANPRSVVTAEDTPAPFTLTGTDADGDPLSFSVETQPLQGTLTGQAPNLIYTPRANYNGPDSFTFRVNDGLADSVVATVSITVLPVNDPPAANNQTLTTPEDTALPITLTGSDIDGDALTFTVVVAPLNGRITGTAPNVVYIPNANYNGPDSFSFVAFDGLLTSPASSVSIAVSPVNDAPVANPQDVTTAEDTSRAIVLTGSDIDGDVLSYSIVAQPSNGVLTVAGADVTYTPAPNYFGADSFTFRVNDGALDSATVTVAITVTPVNDAPVASPDAAQTATRTAVTIAVLANDTDVEGNPLSITSATNPANGQVTVNANGTITYLSARRFVGTDTFSYTVSDGQGGTATALVTVVVGAATNAPPAAVDDRATTAPNTPVLIAVLANDSDPNGDPLTVTAVTQANNGTVVINADGTVTYTPTAVFNGQDRFTYTISDGRGGTATASVRVRLQ